jgi:hypothetical protein
MHDLFNRGSVASPSECEVNVLAALNLYKAVCQSRLVRDRLCESIAISAAVQGVVRLEDELRIEKRRLTKVFTDREQECLVEAHQSAVLGTLLWS